MRTGLERAFMVAVQQDRIEGSKKQGEGDGIAMVKIIECEVYSRVVGYYRPVQQYNIGKRQEFNDRTLMKAPGGEGGAT